MPILAAIFRNGKRTDVHAVGEDGSLGNVVKAADEIDERAFARAARPDQADHFAGLDLQIQTVQHFAGAVFEAQRRAARSRPFSRPGCTGTAGSATLGTRSRISKIRCAAAAARCVAETMKIIDSIRVKNRAI